MAAGFNPVFGAGVGSLSGDNKVADDFSTEANRGSTLKFSQTPNRSSEASVKIPAPLGEPFTPISFKRGARKASGFSSSESDDETRRTNVQSVSDLVSHEDVVLGVNETRAKWGPVGGPILKNACEDSTDAAHRCYKTVFGEYLPGTNV